MRKRNMNIKKLLAMLLVIMTTVAFTPAIAFEAFAVTDDGLDLTLVDESKTTYMEGDPILVKATGTTSTSEEAWVGLYKVGENIDDPLNGGAGSLRWFYVAAHSGEEMDITSESLTDTRKEAIGPGEYQLVLFGDGLYGDIRKTINITVTADPEKEPAQPSDELSLALVDESKTTYKIGEPINVRATGTAPGAWVGMYEAGATKDPDNGGVTSYRWFYTADKNGEIVDISASIYDQNNRGSMGEGAYEIILFGDGGYTNIIKTIPITIEGMIDIDESQFSIETDKSSYSYGENIKVKATGTGINDGAWVGLYTADTKEYNNTFLYYYYVRDYEGVFTIMQTKTAGSGSSGKVADGKYKLIVFADSGYLLPVKSVEITVTRDILTSKRIREPGCVTYGLEYVEFKDGFSEYREIPTLGGHDWTSPEHIKGTSTHKYTCKRNEAHKAKVEDCARLNGKVLKAATTKIEGTRQFYCDVCDTTYTETIPKLKASPKLTYTSLAYNGSNRKPALQKVYDANGDVIPSDFYTVTYPSKCKSVGTYKATVKFKGDYSGKYSLTYKVIPKAVTFSKLTKGDNSFKASWKRNAYQTSGYQIKYSTSKTFKNAKYKKVKGIKATSTTVSKLKNKKTYYVKVRAYKVVGKKTYYSTWSSYKYVKTK